MHDNGASKVFCTIDIGWFRRVWFDDIVLLFVSTSNFDTRLKIAAHITSFYGLDWSFFELDSPFMTSPRLKSSPRTYVRTQFSRYSLLILHLWNRWDWNVLLALMSRLLSWKFRYPENHKNYRFFFLRNKDMIIAWTLLFSDNSTDGLKNLLILDTVIDYIFKTIRFDKKLLYFVIVATYFATYFIICCVYVLRLTIS